MEKQSHSVKSFIAWLQSIKHIEWIVLLLVAGAIILVYASGLPKAETPATPVSTTYTSAPSHSDLENRMASILSQIENAGKVSVLVNSQENLQIQGESITAITGVVVVAEGAYDLSVRLALARAVQSLLDVPQSNIEIFAMAKESEDLP